MDKSRYFKPSQTHNLCGQYVDSVTLESANYSLILPIIILKKFKKVN